MDPTYLRILSVGGILIVALLTTVGALVISWLVARVVQAALAVVGWLTRVRTRPTEARHRTGEAPGTQAVQAGSAHGLLARQAWRRVRC